MTDPTPDRLAQDDAEATRIAREIREGLPGVTPGPWLSDAQNIYGDEDGGAYSQVALTPSPHSPSGSARLRQWYKDSAHIDRCSPDRLDILTRAFEARGAKIKEMESRAYLLIDAQKDADSYMYERNALLEQNKVLEAERDALRAKLENPNG